MEYYLLRLGDYQRMGKWEKGGIKLLDKLSYFELLLDSQVKILNRQLIKVWSLGETLEFLI